MASGAISRIARSESVTCPSERAAEGETKLVIGSADARKNKLDTIVKTALVIKF